MCLSVNVGTDRGQQRVLDTGSCEPTDWGAGYQTHAPSKSNTHSLLAELFIEPLVSHFYVDFCSVFHEKFSITESIGTNFRASAVVLSPVSYTTEV